MDIFNNETTVEPKLEEFVGEGKKYATPDAVAKALVEKDRFIERLQTEAREREKDFQERENTKAFNDRIAALEQAQLTEHREPSPREVTPPQPTPIDEEAIQRVMEQREQAQARTRNLITVKDKLTETFGADYPNRVKARAAELGIGLDRLNQMAAETPTAFFALIGLGAPAPQGDFAPPQTQRNSAAFVPEVGRKNYAYYREMRKTNPSKYWTPAVQLEEYNEAKRQGESFGS